jgi:ankyrin repeat protein
MSEIDLLIEEYASHPEFLGVEIVDVNQPGYLDNTLLHLAAGRGNLDHIKILVRAGAKVDVIGDLGNTPLHDAAMLGQAGAVSLLLEFGANPNVRNEFGETPVDVATSAGQEGVVQILRKPLRR